MCATQTDANTVRTDLTTWLTARPDRWTNEGLSPIAARFRGQWLVIGDCGFMDRGGAQALFDRVVSRWTTGTIATRILAGSWVKLHDCHHDVGAATPCTWDAEATK